MSEDIRLAMRQARESSGLAWDEFARRAGFSRPHLRSVENGTRGVTEDVVRAYDRVLGTGGVFAATLAGREDPEGSPWTRSGALAALLETSQGAVLDLDRRRFVVTGGAALAALTGRWTSAVAAARPVLPTTDAVPKVLATVANRLEELRHLGDELGSGTMAQLARNELALTAQVLKSGRMTGREEDLGLSLAAEAARQVGWNLFDGDRQAAAERYYALALRASAAAGDRTTGAYAMSFMAVQHYTVGNPRDAVSLLETAEAHVGLGATPRMQAMLAARRARALSKTGDLKSCARALNRARDLVGDGPNEDDPPFLYWVTPGEVEMIAGSCALQLRDPQRALRNFHDGLAADYPGDEDHPRLAAIYLARIAEAHVENHDLDEAVDQARYAVRCLGSVDSARSSDTLAGVRAKLQAHRGNPKVRDFLQVG
ncbi:hypothetical protein GCM10009839_58640 [Catenulispora yoronensis]|uniref:HTH cro/C1-type domain-containing protein n=1 Tax=Catenulispora yoronensis TaxID=450799 RepID=A0ABP5GI57_9ACTN